MRLLRDKKRLTQFLILYHSAIDQPNKLADIASELDMSEQGVSNYVLDLEEEGLIDTREGQYHPTSEGMELVRDVLSALGDFLDSASDRIDFIDTCTAISDVEIEEGDEVGLFMREGFLHASLDESSSMGTALTSAEKREPVLVGGLHGITDLELGKIYLVPADVGDTPSKEAERVGERLFSIDHDLVAVKGEAQYGLMNILGMKPEIRFAPIESTISAAEKGLDISLLVSEKRLDPILEKIRDRNRGREEAYRIRYEVID